MTSIRDNAGDWEYAGTVIPTANEQWTAFPYQSESATSLLRLTLYYQNTSQVTYLGQIRIRYLFPTNVIGPTVSFWASDEVGKPFTEGDRIKLINFHLPAELSLNPSAVKKVFEIRKVRKRYYRKVGWPVLDQDWGVGLEYLNQIRITDQVQGVVEDYENLINAGTAFILTGDPNV